MSKYTLSMKCQNPIWPQDVNKYIIIEKSKPNLATRCQNVYYHRNVNLVTKCQ